MGMRRAVLTLSAAVVVMTGCASNSSDLPTHEVLVEQGELLYGLAVADAYEVSTVEEIEIVRTAVNSAFLVGLPAYEEYTGLLADHPEVNDFILDTERVGSENEKHELYDALSVESKLLVDNFLSDETVEEVANDLREATIVASQNISLYEAVDTTRLLEQLEGDLLVVEKDRLAYTADQVAFLNASVVHSYDNYRQLAQMRTFAK